MTAKAFLDASVHVEQALVLAVTSIAVLALIVAAMRGTGEAATPELHLSLPLELGLVALVVAVALVTRTIGYGSGLTAPASLSALIPLDVGKMLADGTLETQWLALFREFQSGAIQNSAMLLPIAAAFQEMLGPSLHLPLLIGAFYGTVAVVLAWAFGRVAVSSVFGVVFAALLAISPLQIAWARLGGVHITVVTHVLLAAWCGYLAGKRGSLGLAVLTGAVMWASLYQYAAARIGIVIAPAMLIAGLRSARVPARRSVAVLGATLAAVLAIYAALRPDFGSLWPAYPGYVGNKGERSVTELMTQNLAPVVQQLRLALDRYFLSQRAGPEAPVPPYRWGIRTGGLSLVPVTLLGLIGLVATIRHPGRGWPFLLLAAAGLGVPVLSVTTARRLLIFDLAWCGFASAGLLLLVRASRRLGAPAGAAFALALVLVVAIGSWSFASVVALNQALPDHHYATIPFGESGFGDGVTCVRCQRAAYEWRDEIARDGFVVLFDTDLDREMIAIGGLTLYGRVAALSTGRPRSFLDFYPVMRNLDFSKDAPGPSFDPARQNFASYIIERIETARPSTIIWHFECPTQWERWLAGQLVAAGGTAVEVDTSLARSRGLQVRTDWSRREAAFGVLTDLVRREHPAGDACSSLRVLETRQYQGSVLQLGAVTTGSADRPPEWLVGSWDHVTYGARTMRAPLPVGTDVAIGPNRADVVQVLTRQGANLLLGDGQPRPARSHVRVPDLLGLDCGARIGGEWWAVDPTSGALLTTGPKPEWIPDGRWIGITRDGPDRVVLGSADQFIAVFDVRRRTEVARFPVTIPPSRRLLANECSPIVAGDGWVATFDHLTSMLVMYDRTGRPLGGHDLSALPGFGGTSGWLQAVAASGNFLAVARGTSVTTVAITIDPGCAAHTTEARGA
jgi:hypothetical protein